ncbi:MAG: glycosyltransferase, partial [Candidatus Omnitrophica bacterium]|nr:glycosyltransferase [Candidatus Omnitrophota bacterium]
MATKNTGQYPSVAVLVAARHEPKEVLEATLITLNAMHYKNKKIYLLDDSSIDSYKKEAEELASEFKINLFRRVKPRHGAKAGIINDCLEKLDEKYIAIFDADQNPLPEFLNALIPILESEQRLAFIQTPQFYTNIEEGRVARAAAFQQAVFYEYICEGKSSSGSMFCCGTNVVFRLRALLQAGGLDESTVTEDFATSVKIHSLGWKSLYYDKVYAFGMGPENLNGYFKQQFRWATGTIAIFKKLILKLITKPLSLTPAQWWEYFLSSSYYLIGIAFLILMACPILYIFFNIPSFFAKPEVYFFTFVPYITLSMAVFYMVLRKRNYRVSDLFLGQLLSFVTTFVYFKAGFSAILGLKTGFEITSKAKLKTVPYFKLRQQIVMIAINFSALTWAINRFMYEQDPALLINGFWALHHAGMFLSVFYFNEEPK